MSPGWSPALKWCRFGGHIVVTFSPSSFSCCTWEEGATALSQPRTRDKGKVPSSEPQEGNEANWK